MAFLLDLIPGNKSSTKNTVNIKNDTINSTVSELIQKNSQSVASSHTNLQTLKIVIKNSTINDTITQNQTLSASSQVTGTLNAAASSKVLSNIAQAMEPEIVQQTKNSNGWLSLSSSNNKTVNDTKLTNSIHNAIENKITQENYNNIVNSVFNAQTGEITIDGSIVNAKINQDQNLVSNLISESLLKSVLDATSDNLVSQGIKLKLTQSTTNENKGLDSMFSGKNGIILAVVCCICCLMSLLSLIAGVMMNSGGGGANIPIPIPVPAAAAAAAIGK